MTTWQTTTVRSTVSPASLLLACGPDEAKELGLGLGDRLRVATTSGDLEAAFSGFLNPRALELLLCTPRVLGRGAVAADRIAHFAYLDGTAPIVLEVEPWAPVPPEAAPADGSEVSIRRVGRGGLCGIAHELVGKARPRRGRLQAHALYAGPGALLLNVTFLHLRRIGVAALQAGGDPLTLAAAGQERTVHLELHRRPDALRQARERFYALRGDGASLRAGLERLEARYRSALHALRESLAAQGASHPAVETARAEGLAALRALHEALPTDLLDSLPLVSRLFPSWRDPDEKLLLLEPLVGARLGLAVSAGEALELRRG